MIKNVMGFLIRTWRKPHGFGVSLFLSIMNIGHLHFIKKVLSEFQIKPTETVLDVGCGGGNAVRILAKSAARVYGIDYSPACVEKSLRVNRSRVESGRVFICEGDAGELPFENDMFDLITAFETVYFWPDIDSAFRAIRSKLKPSGIFLVACETRRQENGEKHYLEKDIDTGNGTFRIFGRSEMKDILEQAGFINVNYILPQKSQWLCLSAQKKDSILY